MKKTVSLLLIIVICAASLSACAGDGYLKRYGASDLYDKSDMDAAVRVIMRRFRSWEDDCRMIEVAYAGDEVSKENLSYCNSLTEGAPYDACIVFETAFRTLDRTQGLNPNDFYTGYRWYLARTGTGQWKVVGCGYG